MAGVLVSGHKTMVGLPSENPRYPTIERAQRVVSICREFAWPVIHFNSRSGAPLGDELAKAASLFPGLGGIQMNVASPERDEVERFRRSHPDVEIILQVRKDSIASLRPDDVDAYVRRYVGLVDHALLDLSCGTNQPLDAYWAWEVVRMHGVSWLRQGVRPGFAGGLGPGCADVVRRLGALLGSFAEECSWDAESGLRGEGDVLDHGKVVAYREGVRSGLATEDAG